MKRITVEALTSPGCKNCEAFRALWDRIKTDWPNVEMRERSVTTPEGQRLAQEHMILASPGIVINGKLFSTGGVDEDAFIAALKEQS